VRNELERRGRKRSCINVRYCTRKEWGNHQVSLSVCQYLNTGPPEYELGMSLDRYIRKLTVGPSIIPVFDFILDSVTCK
jgi:hypothetical protein